jgi:uncharacterized protein
MATPSESILNRLRALKPALAARGVTRLRVFGSVARGEARDDSDVDLIVDFDQKPDLLEFSELRLDLIDLLGRDVDLLTDAAIHPRMRVDILNEARDVE